MTTNKSEILSKLRELHRELSEIKEEQDISGCVDEPTIDALGQLITDAGAILDQMKEDVSSSDTIREEHDDLTDRIMKFESEHPRVTGFLHQVTDVLAMMGI